MIYVLVFKYNLKRFISLCLRSNTGSLGCHLRTTLTKANGELGETDRFGKWTRQWASIAGTGNNDLPHWLAFYYCWFRKGTSQFLLNFRSTGLLPEIFLMINFFCHFFFKTWLQYATELHPRTFQVRNTAYRGDLCISDPHVLSTV